MVFFLGISIYNSRKMEHPNELIIYELMNLIMPLFMLLHKF